MLVFASVRGIHHPHTLGTGCVVQKKNIYIYIRQQTTTGSRCINEKKRSVMGRTIRMKEKVAELRREDIGGDTSYLS